MLNCLLLLSALHGLIGQSAASHLVNHTVQEGDEITLPCMCSRGDGYFYRTWRRGYESLTNHSSKPLFQQVGGSSPDEMPGARSDMDVDNKYFNLTIKRVHAEDHNVVFTCLQYKKARHTYSYVQLQVEGGKTEVHHTALIAGICVGAVVLLLLATGVATYRVKRRTRSSGDSLGTIDGTEDMSVGFASGSSTMRLYTKQD